MLDDHVFNILLPVSARQTPRQVLLQAITCTGRQKTETDRREWVQRRTGQLTHIVYLMVDPEIVTTRTKEDKTRERKQLPIERLQKWQEAEMMELRAVCRDYGIIFTTITETPTTTLGRAGERLATLLNNFHSHDEASNTAAVEQAVDTALNGQEDLDTVLLLNADKALAPHDTKLMFWKGITFSGGSIECSFD